MWPDTTSFCLMPSYKLTCATIAMNTRVLWARVRDEGGGSWRGEGIFWWSERRWEQCDGRRRGEGGEGGDDRPHMSGLAGRVKAIGGGEGGAGGLVQRGLFTRRDSWMRC